MAAEDTGVDREQGSTTIDSGDFQDIIRGGTEEPKQFGKNELPKDVADVVNEAEAQVVVDRNEEPRGGREEGSTTVDETNDLSRALSTIDRLSAEVSDLRRGSQTRQTQTREPNVEMMEFAPGISLPKDVNQWPLKVTPDVLRAVGIDPGEKGELAQAFNILGNALFTMAVTASSRGAAEVFYETMNRRETEGAHRRAFFTTYSDLQGAEDIVANTEQVLRRQGLNQLGLSDAEYAGRVAMASRARLAKLRNVSIDDYMKSVSSGEGKEFRQNVVNGQRSRARFGGSNGRPPRGGTTSVNDRELNDMITR